MKKLIFAAFALLLLGFVCRAEAPKVYLTHEGSLYVTANGYDGTAIDSITLGSGEGLPIQTDFEVYKYYTSGRYSAVVKDGVLCTADRGSARINIYYSEKEYITLAVEVKKAPNAIKVSPESAELEIGNSGTLTCKLPDGTAGSIRFSSSNSEVASVDSKGVVTAHTPGEAVISATAYNGVSADCTITVPIPAPARVIVPERLQGYALESITLPVEFKGGWGDTVKEITSSHTEICRVEADGSLYCVSAGECTVTVTSSRGESAVCSVSVLPCAQSIQPVLSRIVLYEGGTVEVSAITQGGSGAFSVSTQSKVLSCEGTSVSATAVGEGSITLTAVGGASCTCPVTVMHLPKELKLVCSNLSPAAGESVQLSLWEGQGVYLNSEYYSENDAIATVSQNGKVTCLSDGEVTLVCVCGGVRFEQCLTVQKPASRIAFDCEDILLGACDSIECAAHALDGGGSICYTVSDNSVAEYKDGVITALVPGQAVLCAICTGGAKAAINVTVCQAAKTIVPDCDTLFVGEGDSLHIAYSFEDGEYSLVSLSSDSDCIRLEGNRVFGLKQAKNIPVSLKTAGGVTASIMVSVLPAPKALILTGEQLIYSEVFSSLITLNEGDSLILSASAAGLSGVSATFESCDSDIAAVDGNVLYALKSGTARIDALSYNGIKGSILVEVKSSDNQ